MPTMPQVPDRGAIVRFAAANAAANASRTPGRASRAARQAAERTGLRETVALRADAPAFFSTHAGTATVLAAEPAPALADDLVHEPRDPATARTPSPPLNGAYAAAGASESAAHECYRTLVSAASQSGYDEQNAVGAWAQITWFGLQVFGFSPSAPFSPPPNDAQVASHPGLMYLPPAPQA